MHSNNYALFNNLYQAGLYLKIQASQNSLFGNKSNSLNVKFYQVSTF